MPASSVSAAPRCSGLSGSVARRASYSASLASWAGRFVPIAVFSYGLALLAHVASRQGWLRRQIHGLGGSYIALVTAVLVVSADGSVVAWVLPALIGVPLISLTITRIERGGGPPRVAYAARS